MAPWMAANASLTGSVPCSSFPPVVIEGPSDYQAYMSNATLRGSTALGTVVVTWVNISDAELVNVLANKVALGELVLQGLTQVTAVSAALGRLTSVTTRIVLDTLPGVSAVAAPLLTSVGGGFRVFGLTSATSLSFPNITSIGGDVLFQNNVLATSMSFDSLTSINGSMAMYNIRVLTPAALSNSFSALQTVADEVIIQTLGVAGAAADIQTALVLPQLTSIGSLYMRDMRATVVSMPALQTIGGTGQQGLFFFQDMQYVRSLDFPSLASVSGRMQLINLLVIANLCQLGLPATGYLSSTAVSTSIATIA